MAKTRPMPQQLDLDFSDEAEIELDGWRRLRDFGDVKSTRLPHAAQQLGGTC